MSFNVEWQSAWHLNVIFLERGVCIRQFFGGEFAFVLIAAMSQAGRPVLA